MAEALCGPSNPLQTFQKHTSLDRTLQQERLAFRSPPTQGFRSTPAQSSAGIDVEFYAFQASQPLDPQSSSFHRPQSLQPVLSSQPQLENWASDFHNLRPKEQSSLPLHLIPNQQTRLQNDAYAGWHQEFLGQQSGQTSHVAGPFKGIESPHSNTEFMRRSNMLPDMERLHINNPFTSGAVVEKRQEDNFDERAFERAFDAANAEMESFSSKGKDRVVDVDKPSFDLSHACTDPGDVTGEYDFDAKQYILRQEAANEMVHLQNQNSETSSQQQSAIETQNGPRIGSDNIPAHPQQSELAADTEADELARTAGHILDNLKHEQSQKFQKSNFLELMRQLRDKEVRVEGDKISSMQSAHPGGRFYPYDAFTMPEENTSVTSNEYAISE